VRIRRNDIQPTQPGGRVIALPMNEPLNSNVQQNRPQVRAVRVQHRPQTPQEENIEQIHEPIRAHNRPPTREQNHEVHHERNVHVRRGNETNVRGDGNFRNKNVQMNMPEAG